MHLKYIRILKSMKERKLKRDGFSEAWRLREQCLPSVVRLLEVYW